MRLSSVLISLLIHILILSLKFDFNVSKKNDLKSKKIEEKIIRISLKTLKNKKIIELDKYNDNVDPNSKYISFNDNFSKNKEVSAESIKNKKNNEQNKIINKEKSNEEIENKKISEDVNSDKTDISTTKFAYFDYYKKMKKIVDVHFSSLLKEKNIEEFVDENIAETYILLKINSKGEILSKKIDKSSGYIAIDFAALESFNNIKLPSPPEELLNNKEFVFIQWGFSLK